MGRRREFRDSKLYVRIHDENNEFLNQVCSAAKMTKTEWIDLHLAFLRGNMKSNKAAQLVTKGRDKIQGAYKTAS